MEQSLYIKEVPQGLVEDIKSGKFDMEGCPIKSDALYEYVQSVEDPDIINNIE